MKNYKECRILVSNYSPSFTPKVKEKVVSENGM